MRVEILGSAGALPTPRPGCSCHVCAGARDRGIPYARSGPSAFVHGPDVLLDTPEEIREQLDRSSVRRIVACFYSHWHPDHVMGRRIWETMYADFRSWPRRTRGQTTVYLPEQVAADSRRYLALWEHLSFMAERGWIEVVELQDGQTVELGGTAIRPFRVAEDYVYAFLFEQDGRRLLVAPDELNGWDPPPHSRGVDLAVIPMGVCEFDPFTGERRIDAEHPILRLEATFVETLGIVAKLEARRVVLSHIEEMDGLSYDDLSRLERELDGVVTFAYDGMLLDV
jgi:phosphoribosyl 1,2-cyclic phosphate phosphodiesterase